MKKLNNTSRRIYSFSTNSAKWFCKILRADTDDRAALLYYLSDLDSCAMSLTCCLDRRKSEIMAIADEKTRLIAILVEKVEEWVRKYPTWKQFNFYIYVILSQF